MMMFLKNAWYVAAWDHEITHELSQITVLGEKICVWRATDGTVSALEDACPHRKLPLSMGRLQNDAVECGYHGLTFDGAGQCIFAPGQGRIPSKASVRHYATHERYGLVWIWMGDAHQADNQTIFQVDHFDGPSWGINRGAAMELDCNYLYVTDNLLDPSHVSWVHQSSFAQDATKNTPLRVTHSHSGVTVDRWMMNVEPAPFYQKVIEFDGRCDRLQHYEVRYPSHAIIRAVFTPAGTGGADGPMHENTFIMDSYNFMTPTSETQTRYYWFQLRNVRPDDDALSKMMSEDVHHAFEEDRAVLNQVQIGMDNALTPPISLAIDTGPMRFRHDLAIKIANENHSQTTNDR